MHVVVGLVDDVNYKFNDPTVSRSAFWNSTSAYAADASDGNGRENARGGHACNWLRSRADTSDISYKSSSATQHECTRHNDGFGNPAG